MHSEDMILASEFCIHHNIELSLLYSLNASGLIEITTVEEEVFVPENQLVRLEQIVRLYNELDINLEGIETITYLLQRVNDMRQHIQILTNKLRVYENE